MLKRVPRRRGRRRPPLTVMRGGATVETFVHFELYRCHAPQERVYLTHFMDDEALVFEIETTIHPHMSDRVAWRDHYAMRRIARSVLRYGSETPLSQWQGKVRR